MRAARAGGARVGRLQARHLASVARGRRDARGRDVRVRGGAVRAPKRTERDGAWRIQRARWRVKEAPPRRRADAEGRAGSGWSGVRRFRAVFRVRRRRYARRGRHAHGSEYRVLLALRQHACADPALHRPHGTAARAAPHRTGRAVHAASRDSRHRHALLPGAERVGAAVVRAAAGHAQAALPPAHRAGRKSGFRPQGSHHARALLRRRRRDSRGSRRDG
mmetsp:Transcript_12507/g.53605  ORF Transcript_12507/g.53605 Transcript_12507/m.53605 type:complete len:220 (-) Transcript_12507:323-982(-)